MLVNQQHASTAASLQRSIPAIFVEDHVSLISRDDDSHADQEVIRSAPIATYDSTPGVCNQLARIALNRSAVMQAYDSMFPRSAVNAERLPGAAARRRSQPSWLRRVFAFLFARPAR